MEVRPPAPATGTRPPDPVQAEQLRNATRDFEGVFLNLMMANMRQTVHADARFAGGVGERMFRPMLDEQFATAAARRGRGLGIGEMLYRSLEKTLPRQADATLDVRA